MLKKILIVAAIGLSAALFGPSEPADAIAQPGTYNLSCYPYPPLNYYFNQYVSGWGYHAAEDVCHQEGLPVFAAADGTVVYSARTPDSYRWGNLIIIEHRQPDGGIITSLYGHLSDRRAVAAGQRVYKGQHIGYIGASGPQNGYWSPHTHFGMRPGPYPGAIGTYAPGIHGYYPTPNHGWVSPQNYVNARRQNYDYLGQSLSHQGFMYYNDGMEVVVKVRNSGNQTWRTEGSPNPTRLATLYPRDHASSLSANGTANGWVSPNRIRLESDTPPDGEGTFRFRLESNQQPGVYRACYALVTDGITAHPERPICVDFTLLPPGWRSQYVKQLITNASDPSVLSPETDANNLLPGQKRNFKVILKNVGELPWDVGGANPTRLGTSRPLNRGDGFATMGDGSIPASENWVTGNRPSGIDGRWDPGTNSVVADTQITNGEHAVFSWTMTAPDIPGSYQVYYNPVVEGQTWMPDLAMWFPISVADRGYHYQWVSQGQSTQTISGATKTISATLRLRNVGREPWPVGGSLNLGTDRPRDHSSFTYTPSGAGAWLSASRPSQLDSNVTSPGKTTVDTNEVGEFAFTMTVDPSIPAGRYGLYVRPVMEGVTWLPEDYGIHFPFTVSGSQYSYQYVTQTNPTGPLTTGNPARTATVVIRNTGRDTWSSAGPTPFRLGTERPKDRGSAFAGGSGWLGSTRVVLNRNLTDSGKNGPPVTVAPGEQAEFSITFTRGSVPPGMYQEYFTPVLDGLGWLPDIGLYVPITVQ